MTIPLSLLLSLLLSFPVVMVDPHLHGVVLDHSTHRPLQGATVRVLGTRLGAITDADGAFHVHDLRGDSATLEVSMVGFTTQRLRVPTRGEADVVVDLLPQSMEQGVYVPTVTVIGHSSSTAAMPSQPTTVLSMEELDATRGSTFSDALENVTGVAVMRTGPSIAKPMIHGMSGTRLVLTQAGVAQEGQQWGEEHGPEIDPFLPARVTIVKGASGVRLGPNAMGGAISVDPEPLTTLTSGWRGEASSNLFSNALHGAVGGWLERTRLFDEDVSVRAHASARRAGDASTPDAVLGNTGFSAWSGAAQLTAGDQDLGLSVYGSHFATTLGIYAGSHLGNAADLQRAIERGRPSTTYDFTYAIGNPRQEIGHTLLSLQGHAALAPQTLLKVSYGWQQNDRSEFDKHNARIIGRGTDPVERARDSIARLQRSLATPAMNLLLTTYTATAEVEHQLGSSIQGSAGVSGLRQVNDRSGRVFLVPDFLALGAGAWLYENYVAEDWSVNAGLRYDRRWLEALQQQKIYEGVSGSVGAMVDVTSDLRVQGNLGLAWRPPAVNELYSNDVHHGVARFEIGDSLLQAERSTGADLTVRWAAPSVEIEATAYGTWFSNYIFSVPDPDHPTITIRGVFPTFRFRQTQAMISGVDLSATVSVTSEVSIYGKGALVRGWDQVRAEPLFMMPADRLRLGTHVHLDDVLGMHESYVDVSVVGVRHQDQFVPGQDYVDPPPGYTLVDVAAGGIILVQSTQIRWGVTVRNLLNTSYRDYLSRYRYFADDPGRDIVLRFTIPFGDLP